MRQRLCWQLLSPTFFVDNLSIITTVYGSTILLTYKIEFWCVIVGWTGQGFRDVKNKWHDQITVAIVLVEMWKACVY